MFYLDKKNGKISLADGFKVEYVSENDDNEILFLVSGPDGKLYVSCVLGYEILEPSEAELFFQLFRGLIDERIK